MTGPAETQVFSYHVVMLSFEGIGTAHDVTRRLKAEGGLEGCEIEAEATVWRDPSGEVHFHERGAPGIGAAVGVATAGVVAFVTGPVILPALVVFGAVAGGIAGHFAGQILPPEDLREVGEMLPPGHSAYVAVVDVVHAGQLADAFGAAGARVLNVPVETEVASVIREGITGHIRRV